MFCSPVSHTKSPEETSNNYCIATTLNIPSRLRCEMPVQSPSSIRAICMWIGTVWGWNDGWNTGPQFEMRREAIRVVCRRCRFRSSALINMLQSSMYVESTVTVKDLRAYSWNKILNIPLKTKPLHLQYKMMSSGSVVVHHH